MKYTVEVYNGNVRWYKEGTNLLHREDGPAREYANGDKAWYQNGELHRLDGPACEFASGDKAWYQNGKCHREDGPAVEFKYGTFKAWYQNGKRHRLNGPAIEDADYGGEKRWFFEGRSISCSSQEEFEKIINNSTEKSQYDKTVIINGKKFKLVEV